MKFYQRLAYYLFGFGIGMVFLFMVLNGKDTSCSYFPNARVLKNLRSKPFHYGPAATQKLSEKWVDTSDVRKTLTYGDVDFDKSNVPMNGGKRYMVEGQNKKAEKITLEVVNFEDRVLLMDIHKGPSE